MKVIKKWYYSLFLLRSGDIRPEKKPCDLRNFLDN